MEYKALLLSLIFAASCSGQVIKEEHSDIVLIDQNCVSGTVTAVNGNVLLSSWDTAVRLYSLENGKVTFETRTKDICYAKPRIASGNIYFPISNDEFVCIDTASHNRVWAYKMQGRCSDFNLIGDSILLASVKRYGLVALNSYTGELLYEIRYSYETCNLPDLFPWRLTYDQERFYVANWQCAEMTCFNSRNGAEVWRRTFDTAYYSGPPLLLDSTVFVGLNNDYENGLLVLLNKYTGEIIAETPVTFEDHVAPILAGKSIYFYSYEKQLFEFDAERGKLELIVHLGVGGKAPTGLFYSDSILYFGDAGFMVNKLNLKNRELEKYRIGRSVVVYVVKWGDKLYGLT